MFGKKHEDEGERLTRERRIARVAEDNQSLRHQNMLLQQSLTELYGKVYRLTNAMRDHALECASRSPGLPEEVMARAEEYLIWLRGDGGAVLVNEDGFAGPPPGFVP